ncbi:MAG: glycoside hydrolase family 172 protein [Phycisphaeraceae bacterium]
MAVHQHRRLSLILTGLGVSALGVPASAQLTGYEPIADWQAIAWSKNTLGSSLFSSYDRAGGNADYNYYVSPTGYVDVVTDTVSVQVNGPGVTRRFWMPHRTADAIYDLRVTVDGVVVYDTNTDDYLAGDVGYVDTALTPTFIGGQTSYEPIAFQDSLLIETNNKFDGGALNTGNRHYYQWNVHTLPQGARVTPTTGTLNATQLAARNQAVQVLGSLGDNPAGSSPTSVFALTPGATINAGSALTLASPAGDGVMRSLNLFMPSATDAELDTLRLRVRYDGSATNAIDVPVSHFFGVGAGRADYQSMPLGVTDLGAFYSYWPMPYRDGAVVELYNPSGQAIAIDAASVEVDSAASPPAQAGYLHAVYHEETTAAGQRHHQILDTQGKGHYVGNLLWLELADDRRNILEGDDIITVDGTTTLYGTGLEDAYSGGYYYNHVVPRSTDGDIPFPESGAGAFSGLLRIDFDTLGDPNTRTDQYRWLITDPVAFETGIDVKIENFANQANVQFGSTAFYYLVPAIEGDLDGDGGVGIHDLDIVLAHWGTAQRLGDWSAGDATNDGWVGEDDLQIVLANWDASEPIPAINVPEPGSVALVSALTLLGRRRRN